MNSIYDIVNDDLSYLHWSIILPFTFIFILRPNVRIQVKPGAKSGVPLNLRVFVCGPRYLNHNKQPFWTQPSLVNPCPYPTVIPRFLLYFIPIDPEIIVENQDPNKWVMPIKHLYMLPCVEVYDAHSRDFRVFIASQLHLCWLRMRILVSIICKQRRFRVLREGVSIKLANYPYSRNISIGRTYLISPWKMKPRYEISDHSSI